MSADIIQAQYDKLDAIAARFGQQSSASTELYQRVARCVAALEHGGWEGRGATAFFGEMHGQIYPALTRLLRALEAARSVTLEVARIMRAAEEEAAAIFQGHGAGADGRSDESSGAAGGQAGAAAGAAAGAQLEVLPRDAPTSMKGILQLLEGRTNYTTIIQTGPNQYMVLVKGTDFEHWNVSNSGIAALQSGVTLPSRYEREVRALIEHNIPPGASINFVGHSLGGIVAHNLTDNQDFNHRYQVQSVTTFGSPQSSIMRDGVEYNRFRNGSDPVPWLDGGLILPAGADGAQNINELATQSVVHSGDSLIAAHDMKSYLQAPELAALPPPRSIDLSNWQDAKIIASAAPTVNPNTNSFLTFADNTASGIAAVPLAIVNRSIEAGSSYLPSEWRDTIDRYNDRAKYFLMEHTPTPSEALGDVVDVLRQGGQAASSFLSSF